MYNVKAMSSTTPVEFIEDYLDIKKGTKAEIPIEKRNDLILQKIVIDTVKSPAIGLYTRFNFEEMQLNKIKIEREKNKNQLNKIPVLLSEKNKNITSLAADIITALKLHKDSNMYYRPKIKDLVEVISFESKKDGFSCNFISSITLPRFINLLQEKIVFKKLKEEKDGFTKEVEINIDVSQAQLLMCNSDFVNSLPRIDKILNYTAAYVVKDALVLSKNGYNENLDMFVTLGSPSLEILDVEEAKKIINEILVDFCFMSEIDKIMAIAYILTPFARGFYKRSTARTPIFLIKANRERAGKDYLAGCVGIIYENSAVNFAPISTGERNDNDELRKRVVAALLSGSRRYHSQNNKGKIDNSFFETITTSETYSDRILGRSENVTLENEMEFSLSGNTGLVYTADLFNRSRIINLFYEDEDANARTFSKTDLHGWIRDNRQKILSAIYTLYKLWFDDGAVGGKGVFSSYPEWAKVVGGVMQYHKLGDPCEKVQDDAVGGDYDTAEMKKLFETLEKLQRPFWTTAEIRSYLQENGDDEDIFAGVDWGKKEQQIKFGKLISKFSGRVLSGIKLINRTPNQKRASRIEWVLTKFGNVAIFGNTVTFIGKSKNEKYNIKVTDLQTLPHCQNLIDYYTNFVFENELAVTKDGLINRSDFEKFIGENGASYVAKILESGLASEPIAGWLRLKNQ